MFTLTPKAVEVLREIFQSGPPEEDGLARYNRLYSNQTYSAFRHEAEDCLKFTEFNFAIDWLSDSAIALCYIYCRDNSDDSEPLLEAYRGKIARLAELLRHKGVSVNLLAVTHLMKFHPNACDYYFGRKSV